MIHNSSFLHIPKLPHTHFILITTQVKKKLFINNCARPGISQKLFSLHKPRFHSGLKTNIIFLRIVEKTSFWISVGKFKRSLPIGIETNLVHLNTKLLKMSSPTSAALFWKQLFLKNKWVMLSSMCGWKVQCYQLWWILIGKIDLHIQLVFQPSSLLLFLVCSHCLSISRLHSHTSTLSSLNSLSNPSSRSCYGASLKNKRNHYIAPSLIRPQPTCSMIDASNTHAFPPIHHTLFFLFKHFYRLFITG